MGKRWEDDDPFEDLYKGWRVDCDVRAGGEYMQRVILLAEEEIDQMCGLFADYRRYIGIHKAKERCKRGSPWRSQNLTTQPFNTSGT